MEPKIEKFEKARKRVRKIRGFYRHLFVFLLVNAIMYIVKDDVTSLAIEASGIQEIGFANYLHWQFWSITISWGIVLLIQGLTLFGRPLIANWEQRKIQKYMDKEDNQHLEI